MRSAIRIGATVLCGFSAGFLSGCAGSSGPPPSLIAEQKGLSPVELYEAGVGHLALGNLDEARRAFEESLRLAGKSGLDFAPPHEGLARLHLKLGEREEAEARARRAQVLDPQWARAYWVLGKVADLKGKPEEALADFRRGLDLVPGDIELTTAAADVLRRLSRESEAADIELGRKVSSLETAPNPRLSKRPPAHSGLSEGESRLLAQLEPFFPGTTHELPPEVLAVFTQPNLTRGALAVLIVGDGENVLARALDRSAGVSGGSSRSPSDVQHRPERSWIDRAVALGFMEILPDGTFRPDEEMTRLTLSLWIEETVATLRNDSRILVLYRGQKSPFPDVPDGHYALNAARIAVDLGSLTLLPGGRFGLEAPVTVDEGIDAIRRLVPALLGRFDQPKDR